MMGPCFMFLWEAGSSFDTLARTPQNSVQITSSMNFSSQRWAQYIYFLIPPSFRLDPWIFYLLILWANWKTKPLRFRVFLNHTLQVVKPSGVGGRASYRLFFFLKPLTVLLRHSKNNIQTWSLCLGNTTMLNKNGLLRITSSKSMGWMKLTSLKRMQAVLKSCVCTFHFKHTYIWDAVNLSLTDLFCDLFHFLRHR